MNCACVAVYVDDCYDDGGQEIRVAGIEYKCGECYREIELGEEYEDAFAANLDDDEEVVESDAYTTCIDCVSARDAFFCGEWVWGRIWEDLGNHLADACGSGDAVSAECMESLTKTARDYVCDLIEEIWDDREEWKHASNLPSAPSDRQRRREPRQRAVLV